MKLQHTFITKAHSLPRLFENVTKVSHLMRAIERESMLDPIRYDPEHYKGDAFEFFVELFLSLHPVDNRVGIYNYVPNQESDNGVDGIGVNIRGEKAVAQIKYRSNELTELTTTKDHLGNLIIDGMMAHGVVADTENRGNFRHFVFTTANGLNFYTDQEMFKSKVRCFGYDDFRAMLDGNLMFWNKAREVVEGLK
jgi:hypothetical protein